ncbi:MAG TPA: hypothetical protein VIO64_11910 [Pseudobacteroides sp.]|uniref:putative motility protein n=1 Tax=Pseudobacteroides sp. TaxID=1968840 RepID=UPI002F949BC3
MSISMAGKVMNGPYDAINTLMLRKALINDLSTSKNLIEGMTAANNKTIEKSAAPHLGSKIDVRI